MEHCTAVLRIETLSRLKLFYLHPLINLTHKGWGGEVYCKYVLYLVELLAVFIYLMDGNDDQLLCCPIKKKESQIHKSYIAEAELRYR